MHRRQSRAQRQRIDAHSVADCDRIGDNVKRVRAALERLERGRDIFDSPDFKRGDFESEGACCSLNLAYFLHQMGAVTGQDRQPAKTRHNLAQQFS